MDSETYGGASLLGLEGTVVIAHGASTARGITSACMLASDLCTGQITEKIRERLGSRPRHPLPAPHLTWPPAAGPRRVRSTCLARLYPWPIPGSPRAAGAGRARRGVRGRIRRHRPGDPAVLIRGLPVQRGPAAGQAARQAPPGHRRGPRPPSRPDRGRRAAAGQRARLHQPHADRPTGSPRRPAASWPTRGWAPRRPTRRSGSWSSTPRRTSPRKCTSGTCAPRSSGTRWPGSWSSPATR